MKKSFILILLFKTIDAFSATPLPLRTALDIALKSNYDIRLAENDAQAARINNSVYGAGALPDVTFNLRDRQSTYDVDQRYTNGTEIRRTAIGSNSLSGDLTVDYTLFNGLRINATRKRLSALQQVGDQQLLLQLQNTMSDVTVRYFDVVRQESYRKALVRSREFSEQKLAIIRQRQEVGLANDADLFQARIDLNTSDQQLVEQRMLIRKSEVGLALVLGVRPDTVFDLTDSIIIDRSIILDTVLKAIPRYPEIMAAAGKTSVNEQLIREIRSQRLPSLRVDGGYSFGSTKNQAGFTLLNRFNGPSAGVTLQVPIFTSGNILTQEKSAVLRFQNARIEEEQMLRRINAQAITFFEAYTTALGQLDRQEESFSMAARVMDLQLMRFSNGQSTILDLRAAQSGFEETAAALVNAQYVAKIAETELKRLMAALR